MDEDHRLAPIELREHRVEHGVAEPVVTVAGEDADPVGVQHVEGVLELAQASANQNGGT